MLRDPLATAGDFVDRHTDHSGSIYPAPTQHNDVVLRGVGQVLHQVVLHVADALGQVGAVLVGRQVDHLHALARVEAADLLCVKTDLRLRVRPS